MAKFRWLSLLSLVAIVFSIAPVAAQIPDGPQLSVPAAPVVMASDTGQESETAQPRTSNRLIVELESPPLAAWAQDVPSMQMAGGRLNVKTPAAQTYIASLDAEQVAFRLTMQSALPQASVSTYLNEFGARESATYRILFNGMAVDPGDADPEVARRTLAQLPGVKKVYLDYAYTPEVYTSTYLIDAPTLWGELGGQADAGSGVKVASMDGGIHHEAPMFDGAGYSYPADFPANGLGFTSNNNGKIIASRVYFRAWDPPAPGEENPWPGTSGTSHGVHTSSTAAGNVVTDVQYLGADVPSLSGVAPGAWVMSYRVFYNSISGDGSFYTAEGLAALEDIMTDGADVLNNSWGGGPGSLGGEFDALDTALINAAEAGIFVSMSNGNSGPGLGTSDHPSPDYINVAASSTSGTYAAGRLSVTAPEPISPTMQNLGFGTADFGAPLAIGQVVTYTYLAAANVDVANATGCNAWPANTFANHAALVSRGDCEFSTKVYYAEQAGAEFVVIYNNAGDGLLSMAAGVLAPLVTIPSVFIGQTGGTDMVIKQADAADASLDAVLELDTTAYQAGNAPDVIADFSSRGPGVGNVLKPDIAAPGVNIMAQGYTPGASGEDRHLGYGQASGTSMAAPHVTGAAALLRSLHPGWSNAYIKSALMSTSKYLDIYNADGSPAQPLDMGAGRLDLANADDPGVILDPPSLSFGLVVTGSTKMLNVEVMNIGDVSETYELSTLYTGAGFGSLTTLPGFTVEPVSITLAAGASTVITVTFDSASGMDIGDNQGFVVLDGDVHEAHMPAWARVAPLPAAADVLIIGSDFSYLAGYPEYLSYYTDALDELGMTYDFWNADYYFTNPTTIPEAAELMAYDAILLFTGDHYEADGTFTVSTPFTALDMDILTEYANSGGTLIAMGQDLSAVLASDAFDDGTFLYNSVLGGNWLQDSVTGYETPDRRIVPHNAAPEAFEGLDLDVGVTDLHEVAMAGFNEVPLVETATNGTLSYGYNLSTNTFLYEVTVVVDDPITITAAHIHDASAGLNGPVLAATFPFTMDQVVDDTLSWAGSMTFTQEMLDAYSVGDVYMNVHTSDYPGGEIRGQLVPHYIGDGAGNQWYIDEIASAPFTSPDNPEELYSFTPLLVYPSPYNVEDGVVAMAHRDQPTLERPGISYLGRSIYTTFGLEGVNDGLDSVGRADLLEGFLAWGADEPQVTINKFPQSNASDLTLLEAVFSSNIAGTDAVSYRWDFGDGSDYTNAYPSPDASHTYARCGTYTVSVEAVDTWGNHVVSSEDISVDQCVTKVIYMPIIMTTSP